MKTNHIIKGTIVFLLTFFLFISCSQKIEQQSSAAVFSVVDSYITHNQLKDASKELRKMSKKSYDIWTVIGIYKRYLKLGEKKEAEKTLTKAIKKHSQTLELKAIYAKFLIEENRLDEACDIAKKLSGTKYGSIYSEAILKKASSISDQEQSFVLYTSKDFYPIYKDAYKSTKNNIWLRNCAILNLICGEYKNAVNTLPAAYSEVNDAYFWSLVLYDGRNFERAASSIEITKNLLKNYENRSRFNVNIPDLIALQSDCYIQLNDFDMAERCRQSLISGIEEVNFAEDKRSVLPIIYMNSALYALDGKNTDSAVDLLFIVVSNWPDFIPGLLKYADLAYELSRERLERNEVQILRSAGIQSLEMEKWDKRRVIPLSDAEYRIKNAFLKTNNQRLQTKLIDLKYKMKPELSVKDKTVDLWKLLEDNITVDNRYSKELVKYVLFYLFDTKQFEDAQVMFTKFMGTEYGCSLSDEFWVDIERKRSSIDIEFMEFAAYFAFINNLNAEALRYYEYCMFESSGIDDDELSTLASYSSGMNLANIYYSTGKKEQAQDLYVKLASRERNSIHRSEIFYRLANIYIAKGDTQNAKRVVEYAITLNPENTRAQFIKVKLAD